MKIGIIGLGLIGGSLAKALKARTAHHVAGYDGNGDVVRQALADGAIDAAGVDAALAAEVCFVCLYPDETIAFINAHDFRGIVCDVCGVKAYIRDRIARGKRYVGAHPMAGSERSGYAAATARLFAGASFILTRDGSTAQADIDTLRALAEEIGFGPCVVTTAEEHDRVIACTSQLAHVVSSAYVKSPTAQRFEGFSAGSFLDMTRVAFLNAEMWTQLFLYNKESLLAEIDVIQNNLRDYRDALASGDGQRLHTLLAEGANIKTRIDGQLR